MGSTPGFKLLLLLATASILLLDSALGWTASCHDAYFKSCYGVVHKCPPGCPKACQVDCKFCKPICACDKPGAVCQDPRFIGGDGIMFYFHGKKDKDFCLVSDAGLHVNAHFIGKARRVLASAVAGRREFTWVQSLGIMFNGGHKLYLGARRAAAWDQATEHLEISLDGSSVEVPSSGEVEYSTAGLRISSRATNEAMVEAPGVFTLAVRVVPITVEESRAHSYDITPDDCFAHLEVNFKFHSLTTAVHGVLGQTYAPGFRSPVKIGVPMPIMGGEGKYQVSSLFDTDCEVTKFRSTGELHSHPAIVDPASLSALDCSSSSGARGMVCRR